MSEQEILRQVELLKTRALSGEYHEVFPLDATESDWRCRTCDTVFTSEHGYAVCPDDPLGEPS